MNELIKAILNAPVPTIVLLAALCFFYLAVGGRLGTKRIRADKISRGGAGLIGGALFVLAVVLYFVPGPQHPVSAPQIPVSGLQIPVSEKPALTEQKPPEADKNVKQISYIKRDPLDDRSVADAVRLGAKAEAEVVVRRQAMEFISVQLQSWGVATTEGKTSTTTLTQALLVLTTDQREMTLEDGRVGVQTTVIGKLDLVVLEQRARNLIAERTTLETLERFRELQEKTLQAVTALQAKNRDLEVRFASLSSAQQEESKREIKQESAMLANRLKATELLQQSVVQEHLGRRSESRNLASEAIKLSPDYEDARLALGRPEDYQYLVDKQSSISPLPYLAVARSLLGSGRTDQALPLLRKLTELFPDRGVLVVKFKFNPSEIDMNTIAASLKFEGVPARWYWEPLWDSYSSIADDQIYFHWKEGLPLRENKAFRVRFGRYHFKPASVVVDCEEFKAGALPHKELHIVSTKDDVPTTNRINGRAMLAGQATNSGIKVTVYDRWHENIGFTKSVRTSDDGEFILEGIPTGQFRMDFAAPGFVTRGFAIGVSNNIVTCFIDSKGAYSKTGITPCNLSELGIQLHKIRNVQFDWTLQEDLNKADFRGRTSQGKVTLKSALWEDWRRGGWLCCQSSFKFGSKKIDDRDSVIDLLVYRAQDGKIYFGQPHNPFIVRVNEDYEKLSEVDQGLTFKTHEEVIVGQTYILKTCVKERAERDTPTLFAKIKVVKIED